MNFTESSVNTYKDPEKVHIVLGIYLATSTLSFLSQLFIIIFYMIYIDLRNKRNFTYRLIFLLAVSDIIVWGMRVESNIERIIIGDTAEAYSHGYCVFLAYIWNFFLLFNVLITLVISCCLILEGFLLVNSQKYETCFYVFICIYCAGFSIAPLFSKNGYGETDTIECWITPLEYDYRYLAFYGHLWAVFIVNCINIAIILLKLRILGDYQLGMVKKLIWLPAIMLIFWLEPSIRRIYDPNDENFVLKVFQYILMPLQGVANAIVYGFVNKTVKEKIYYFLTGKWQNLKINQENNNNMSYGQSDADSNNFSTISNGFFFLFNSLLRY